jgi:hypothetical protein
MHCRGQPDRQLLAIRDSYSGFSRQRLGGAHAKSSRPEHFSRYLYSLEIEDPSSGESTIETYPSMPAVVARAALLIPAGYRVGIWSPSSLEDHPRNPATANDNT